MCHKHEAKMIQDEQDQFDPLHKNVIVTLEKTFIQYNHVEGFDFAPDEMQEILYNNGLLRMVSKHYRMLSEKHHLTVCMAGFAAWRGQHGMVR